MSAVLFLMCGDDLLKKDLAKRSVIYVMGLFIMTLGVSISVKSNLGVSPVSSIPYTMTCVWGIEMGRATIIFHIALVLLQIAVLHRKFKPINLLQVPVGVMFGAFTTFCNHLMTFLPTPENIVIRLCMMLVSTLLIAVGIFFYVPANIMPLAGEGAMLAISQAAGIEFSTVKVIFDISMVIISFAVCMICIGSLGSVGAGTIIAAVLVGLELKLITKLFGRYRDKLLPQS